MYAIIENGGKQYKVSEGDVVRVEKLKANVGDEVTFNVLMVGGDDGVKVGKEAEGAKVTASSKRSSSLSTSPRRTSAKSKVTVNRSRRSRSRASRSDLPQRGICPRIFQKRRKKNVFYRIIRS